MQMNESVVFVRLCGGRGDSKATPKFFSYLSLNVNSWMFIFPWARLFKLAGQFQQCRLIRKTPGELHADRKPVLAPGQRQRNCRKAGRVA
jgi:hypothetical protein